MNALIIANTQIRCDASGRYCLNDLHQASGGATRHKPDNWLRAKQTQELVAELAESEKPLLESEKRGAPIEVVRGGFEQGTYAVKELVYAYAMWISAKFHLHVIRAYDALVTGQQPAVPSRDLPLNADHRADLLVAADRCYRAVIRSGRSRGLRGPALHRAARDAALSRTGVDLHAEHGADADAEATALQDALAQQIERFWAAAQGGELGVPMCPVLTTDLYGLYVRWCREAAQSPASIQLFVPRLIRYAGLRQSRQRWLDGARVVGPHGFLALSEEAPPPGVPITTWNGQCVRRFRAALAARG